MITAAAKIVSGRVARTRTAAAALAAHPTPLLMLVLLPVLMLMLALALRLVAIDWTERRETIIKGTADADADAAAIINGGSARKGRRRG